MRILFVTSSYPANVSDPRGIFIQRLAHALADKGNELIVVTPGGRQHATGEQHAGVYVHRVPYWFKRYQRLADGLSGIVPNIEARPWLALQVPSLIAALALGVRRYADGVDIIHAHWLFPAGLVASSGLVRSGRPAVQTSHGGDLNLARQSAVLQRLCRSIIARSDGFVAVSDGLAEELIALGASPDQTVTIPVGVPRDTQDTGTTHFEGHIGDGLRCIYIGSLIRRKSVGILLQAVALARAAGSNVTCTIVGDGPERTRLELMARTLEIYQHVKFVGTQPPPSVPGWLNEADVLVLPSLSEGRPTAVMEAMAAGIPVIATNIPGSRELIQDGETGLLVMPSDADDLARSMIALTGSKWRLKPMGLKAKRRVGELGLYTDQVAECHLALYRRVLEHRRSSSLRT